MSVADDIRSYVIARYVSQARAKGQATLVIRAGDVHSAMGLRNRLPAVCSALGSTKFEDAARAKRLSIVGPINGSNAVFTFRIRP